MHSPLFEKAKDYYDRGLWSEEQLKALVLKGKLTEDEFKEITGKDI